jgi:ceramide glucosyltransferase
VMTGNWPIVVLAAAGIAVSVWTQAWLQRACHGPRIAVRHLWVPAVLPLVAAFVALSARLNRRVDWRGRSYDLDAEARLGASGSAVAGS